MGQSLKGWVPAPENEKHKDASPKNVRKNTSLCQKEESGMHRKRKKETRKEIRRRKREEEEEEEGECCV